MIRPFVILAATVFAGVVAWNAVADHRAISDPAAAGSVPAHCRVAGRGLFVLPDHGCTPGAVNGRVSQGTIRQTICKRGWTRTVRPPESVTEPIKRRLIRAYGYYAGHRLGSYELDHLVPLELGGAPLDLRNLWPERGRTPNPKDSLERVLNHWVCAGRVSLARARGLIASDWVTAYRRYVR